MKHLIWICLYVVILCTNVQGETAYEVQNVKHGQVTLHVIEFAPEENHGFELVDVGLSKGHAFVVDQYNKQSDLFIINGGYFDGMFRPVGYCQVGGVVLSAGDAPRLSGYVTISKEGKLDLLWKERPEGAAVRDILQAGPYVIDPGGVVGIHSNTGTAAKRTLIAKKQDGSILIITTTAVFLDQLAKVLKQELPEIERALNLDGGPSTGLIYKDVKIENRNPVRNFLRKRCGSTLGSSEPKTAPD
jgi:exopolysaccharide biosynthesis protein